MKKLRERVAKLLKENKHEESIPLLKQLIDHNERRVANGDEPGVDSWLYKSLASAYRLLGKRTLEYEALERYLSKPQLLSTDHKSFSKEAKMKIARRRLFGDAGKGNCQTCKRQLVMYHNDFDEWLCSKCYKVREFEVKRQKWLKSTRELGISLPDDASDEHISEIYMIHRDMSRYIGDVWYHLTGASYKDAIKVSNTTSLPGITIHSRSPLPDFDQFVSSLLRDYAFGVRLAIKERSRTEYAESRLTREQQEDPYKYLLIIAGKPKHVEDADYCIVVKRLYARYADYLPKKPWWKFW